MSRGERGNASVEFIAISIALMVPIAYAIVAIAQVQSAVYGVNGAAQMAGRAYVHGASESTARYAAARAAAIAGRNHGLIITADEVGISCGEAQCLVPGRTVRVTVRTTARVGLAGLARTIAVQGQQIVTVDEFRQLPA